MGDDVVAMGTPVGAAIGDEDGEEVFPPFPLKVTGGPWRDCEGH